MLRLHQNSFAISWYFLPLYSPKGNVIKHLNISQTMLLIATNYKWNKNGNNFLCRLMSFLQGRNFSNVLINFHNSFTPWRWCHRKNLPIFVFCLSKTQLSCAFQIFNWCLVEIVRKVPNQIPYYKEVRIKNLQEQCKTTEGWTLVTTNFDT